MQDFRTWARRAADWGAEYLDTIRDRPVRAQTEPGAIARQLPDAPPENAESMEDIFADFERIVMPGMTNWQHPRFFAYFPANTSPPSVVAEYLTAAIGAQCMLWQTSPAATELETRVMDWTRQAIGLAPGFHGVIQDSASSATLCAILTMRERALDWAGNAHGLAGQPAVRVYSSDQVHSSIDKAIWIAGIGQENLVKVPTKGTSLAMDTDALDGAIDRDRAAGHLPAGIVACIGGTAVGATDDISAVTAVAKRHGLYVHVDAAWAGAAMICPEHRHLMAGCDAADSFVFNPHKWLATNFDCTAHFVRAPEDLTRTLSIQPSYLKTHGVDDVVNYSEWSVPLGRRFRALKLWFVIRAYGLDGLRAMLRNHIAWSRELAEEIDATPEFELVTPPMLSLFSFRYRPAGTTDLDALNQRLVNAVNDDGRTYLTQTRHEGQTVIRFQVGQTRARREDVQTAWAVIREIAAALS